jgi:hypothetical protein
MKNKRVEILLGADGSVKVEAFGFTGASCKEATEFLDDLFGSPSSVDLKDEYFSTDKTTVVDGLPSGYCG